MSVSSIRPGRWRLVRGEHRSGMLLMAGFMAQSCLLVATSDEPLALVVVVGLLTLLQVALLGLCQIWLALHGRVDPHPIPRAWKWALIACLALYLVHILLLPALIPHTAMFHDTIRYRAGSPGLLFYLSAGCAIVAARLLLLPFAIATLLSACLHRRTLPIRKAVWPALAVVALLLVALTRQQAAEFVVWWMD